MEQEGLGQVLPPLHGNDNITWSGGRGRGEGDICSLLASVVVVVVWKIL